jgi:HK97 family phage prohead protease
VIKKYYLKPKQIKYFIVEKVEKDVFYLRAFPKVTRRSSDDTRTTVVISTDGVDRHGTIIDPNGAILDNYNQNPVFLINHDYDLLAGSGAEITVQNNQIVANIDDDMWDLEDERIIPYYNKVKSGKMRAASVGFIPREIEFENEDGEPRKEPIIRKWELLEFSFVTIPSNPEALVTVRNFSKERKEELENIVKSISDIQEEIRELRESSLEVDLSKLTEFVAERLESQPLKDSELEARKGEGSASESVDWDKLTQRTIEQTTNTILKKLGKL